MSYLINLLESLIVSYGLTALCDIKNKKVFFCVNTLITFLVTQFFDCIDQNFISLIVLDEVIWVLIVLAFSRKISFQNLYLVTMLNLICGISATFPIMFIYKYNPIWAGLSAKIIHFLLTFLFILFRRKYEHFESSYWLMFLIIVFLGDCITTFQDEQIISNVYTKENVLTNLFVMVIIGISIYFFHLIDVSNIENERITKMYEKQKYQNLTYSFMKTTKDELNRFEHLMLYKIRYVKRAIEEGKYEDALHLIDQYRDDIQRINYTVYTGNDILDASLSLKIKELDYTVVPCFTISNHEFYDNVQFVTMLLDLLDVIQVKSLNLMIKEEKNICVIQCIGKDLSLCFEKMKEVLDQKTDLIYRYHMQKENAVDFMTIKIRMDEE